MFLPVKRALPKKCVPLYVATQRGSLSPRRVFVADSGSSDTGRLLFAVNLEGGVGFASSERLDLWLYVTERGTLESATDPRADRPPAA